MSDDRRTEVSRRRVLRTVGAGSAAIASSGAFASVAAADEPVETEQITGSELDRLARSVAKAPDTRNVLSDLVAADRPSELVENATETIGARHVFEDGNELTAVSFVTDDGQIVAHYEYDEVRDRVETKARLWDVDRGEDLADTDLRLVDLSVNGESSEISADDCGSCTYEGGWEYSDQECVDVNVSCVIAGCSGCIWACQAGVPTCIGCAVVTCGATLSACCTEYETTCNDCSIGSP